MAALIAAVASSTNTSEAFSERERSQGNSVWCYFKHSKIMKKGSCMGSFWPTG
jgi:hypothetical protein